MNANDIKLELIQWILSEKKAANLQAVQQLISDFKKKSEESQKIVGYRPNGTSVTKKQLTDFILQALHDIDEGLIIETDKVEQESEQW
jgi:hypothetical protein